MAGIACSAKLNSCNEMRWDMSARLAILSDDQIGKIHESTLMTLRGTGVKFWEPRSLEILDEAGASVDKATGVVRFPESLVEEAIRKAPQRITLAGRESASDFVAGDGETHFGTLGTAPLVLDIDTGERRYARESDLVNFGTIADALENIDYFHTSVTPTDMPTSVVDLCRWATAFRSCGKHAMGAAAYNTSNLPYLIRMVEAVSGGERRMRERPPLTATECPVSPLQHDRRPLEGMMEFARNKLPVIVYSEPKAGATSPASLAGTLVVSNCEVLSALILMQAINPGTPVIYGSVATLLDMRYGGIAFGSPETAIMAACTTQMARHYGLPNMTPGGRTDSKMADEQAGYEKMRAALVAALAGASLGNMAGLLESNLVASYEQLLIDNEIIGTINRVAKGLDFDDDALALDLIANIGPGGTYISCRHTMERFRMEHLLPQLSDRRYYATWSRQGSKTIVESARDKARELLEMNQVEPLDDDVDKELSRIIKEAEGASKKK